MLKHPIIFAVILFMILPLSFAGEFDDFVKQNQPEYERSHLEFEQYKKEVAQEFQIYKEIVAQEYEQFRNKVLKNWDQLEISGKKRWVEYTPDFKTRKIVDFEKESIRLEIILDEKGKDADEAFRKLLSDLLLEDNATAFERDSLSQNIEKRIVKNAKHVKTGKVEKKPVLTDIIIGKPKPTEKELERAVSDLKQKGTVQRQKSKKIKGAEVVSLTIPMPPKSVQKKAEIYKQDVMHYANLRKIDEALVFAVIHTESAFNPMARSHVPAYGLMQIVPQSAGMDATQMVFGKPVLLAPSYLYNGNNNINMGTAYLYILFNRYLKNIENLESRLYCVIAAYNTGAGNVAKAFAQKRNIKKASKIINQMSPQEVFNRLEKKLPHAETKKYLNRVHQKIEAYKKL